MNYFVWRPGGGNPGYCSLNGLENVDRVWELREGISRAQGFPGKACFRMNPHHPRDKKLGHQIGNLDGLRVVGKEVRKVLESHIHDRCEWLGVTIFNHKGEVASHDYCIANPLDVVDCIDRQQSEVTWSALDKGKISSCSKLVLLPDSIAPEKVLLRMKCLAGVTLVREDLAKALEDGEFIGLKIVPIEEWSGF